MSFRKEKLFQKVHIFVDEKGCHQHHANMHFIIQPNTKQNDLEREKEMKSSFTSSSSQRSVGCVLLQCEMMREDEQPVWLVLSTQAAAVDESKCFVSRVERKIESDQRLS